MTQKGATKPLGTKRYRSEDEYQAAILAEAKRIWARVEESFPERARQTWEDGTSLARAHTLDKARIRVDAGLA